MEVVAERLYKEELASMRDMCLTLIKKIDTVITPKVMGEEGIEKYIVKGVCKFYEISEDELTGKGRDREMVKRRQVASYLLKTYARCSCQKIADTLGYNRHATVLHHLKEMDKHLSNEIYSDTKIKSDCQSIIGFLCLTKNSIYK